MKTSLFEPYDDSIYITQKCPVCGKVHDEKFKLQEPDSKYYKNSVNKEAWYKELLCNTCINDKEAYEYCYTCNRPVRLKDGIATTDYLSSDSCSWCTKEKELSEFSLYDTNKEMTETVQRFKRLCSDAKFAGYDLDYSDIVDKLGEYIRIGAPGALIASRKQLIKDFETHINKIGYSKVEDRNMREFDFKFNK